MAVRVLSLNTTYAGTFNVFDVADRHSRSASSRGTSTSDGHFSHRPSMVATVPITGEPQTRQTGRLRVGAGAAMREAGDDSGTRSTRKRDRRRDLRPPSLRARAHDSSRWTRARVTPT